MSLFVVLIAILLIGGGAYIYIQNKQPSQPAVGNQTAQAAPAVSLTANPTSITVGQVTTLTVSSVNARVCTGVGTDGSKFYGTGAVSPVNTTTYTFICYESSDQSGRSASASVTVSVSPAPTSTSSLYINKVTMDVGMDGLLMHISGTGFTTASIVHITGNGVDISVSPGVQNGTNLGISLPGNIDINKQYSVYVSNGSTKSNMVNTTKPYQG